MKKYIVLYHASQEVSKKMAAATPEEMKAGMEPWMDWAKKCGTGLVDMGTPLGGGMKVTKNGTSPSTKEVVGYSILQANSMDAAVEMLKNHPHLNWTEGCEIEVHESLLVPGM
jgi:hypothetical protein